MPPKVTRFHPAALPAALSLLALAALACALLGAPTPTPAAPTPTAQAPGPTEPPATAPATPSAEPSAVPSAQPATLPPTPPGGPDPADQEDIVILEPGLGSALIGSVHVAGFAEPTFEQNLVVEITDADGAVIALVPATIQADVGSAGPYAVDLPFAVAADQPGRVTVYSTSARDGGLIHLASVEVNLLASGAAAVVPAEARPEVHAIYLPAPLAEISGGALRVEGFSEYTFEANLVVALCGEGGSGAPDPVCGTADNVLALLPTTINSPDIGQPGPYSADLVYAVTGRVAARLAVYSTSARDGGLTHLASVNVFLNP